MIRPLDEMIIQIALSLERGDIPPSSASERLRAIAVGVAAALEELRGLRSKEEARLMRRVPRYPSDE